MSRDGAAPGAASLHLVVGTALLRPEEQVAEAMLDGWHDQQLARNLAFSTIEGRQNAVKAFARHADAFPWNWMPQMVDEWLGDLRAVRHLRQSTLRKYAEAVRSFCTFLTDPAYGWTGECERRFGTHPIQVCHEWNTAVHLQGNENDPAKRAFTREELQAFFDHADDQIHRVSGAGRKGWLPAFRDATLFKTAYGYGLRRRRDPDAGSGRLRSQPARVPVRRLRRPLRPLGKAMKGSPPKRRNVLTVGPRGGVGRWTGSSTSSSSGV